MQYRKTSENLKHAGLLLSLWQNNFLNFVNIWQSYRQEGCFTHPVHLGTVLRKDEEFVIDFTHDMKKLLLTVVTLVSSSILTLVMTNVNLIRPITDHLSHVGLLHRHFAATSSVSQQIRTITLWDF